MGLRPQTLFDNDDYTAALGYSIIMLSLLLLLCVAL